MEQKKLLSMKIVVDKNSKHVKACNMQSGKILVKL